MYCCMPVVSSPPSSLLLQGYGEVEASTTHSSSTRGQLVANACPFPATPLSISPAEVGGDGHMFSIYLHENIFNCVTWGLYRAGVLRSTVQDGDIPQLRLITDMFAGLVPDLPKLYPRKGMLMDLAMTAPPTVRFAETTGVTIAARYNTNVSVLNATGDGNTVAIAQLTANLSVTAEFGWDATSIKEVHVNYSVLNAGNHQINVAGWNQIIEWVIKQAGPKQTLHQLWEKYVVTPVTPYFALDNVACVSKEQWFVLSGDVELTQLPPVIAARMTGRRSQGAQDIALS